MRGRSGSIVLVFLAALAILAGTAATVLSGRRGTGAPAPTPATGQGDGIPRGSDLRFSRIHEPSRPASVGVLVLRFPERTPVFGAKVVLYTGPGRLERTTDADGRASFADALSGQARIDTTAEGHEPDQRTADLQPGENGTQEILLVESALIEGRVVAAADGTPIARAAVSAGLEHMGARYANIEGGRLVRVDDATLRGPGTTTGADGSFRLRAGRPGRTVRLDAIAEGFAAESVTVLLPTADAGTPATTEIRLSRAGRIRGTIRDTRGRPIAGAAVSAAPFPGTEPVPHPTFRRSPGENSASDGSFVVDGLAVDASYLVQSWGGAGGDPKYGRSPLSRPVEVHLPAVPGEATVDLVLPIWGELVVTWADASGRSDGTARCLAFPLELQPGRIEALSNRATGPGFHLDLAEGRWRVVVDSELCGVGEVEAVVVAEAESRVRVTVGTGPALEGIVVDDEGRPVPGVRVGALRPRDSAAPEILDAVRPSSMAVQFREPPGAAVRLAGLMMTNTRPSDVLPGAALHARTDAAGQFRLDEMSAGTRWLLQVSDGGFFVDSTGPFEVPTSGIRIVAQRRGALQGRLFLPAGAAVPPIRLIHFRSESVAASGETTLRSTAAFGDGSFRIEGLPPGKGRLWAYSATAFLDPIEVVVPPGETADLGTLAMEPAYELAGVVVTSKGGPLAGTTVECSAGDKMRTGADGRFAFSGLPRGELVLRVLPPPPYDSSMRTIRVSIPREDAAAGPLEIRFGLPGVVVGTAKDLAGRPLAGWSVRARIGSEPKPTFRLGIVVSHRGQYECRLDAGTWVLSLHAPGSAEAAAEETVALIEDGRATVDFRVSPK